MISRILSLSFFLLSATVSASSLKEEGDYLFEKLSDADANTYQSLAIDPSLEGLKNTAVSYGYQGGLYIAMKGILERLDSKLSEMSLIDFRSVVVYQDGFLMLPAKVTIQNGREIITETAARRTAYIPRIERQPKFISIMPTWKDYFQIKLTQPQINRNSVLPQNDVEQQIWREKIKEGWEKGIEQAYINYEKRLARLKDDLNGYITYHVLREHNIITEPSFSSNYYALTGGGTSINIDDVMVEVEVNPSFVTNRDAWESISRIPSFLDLVREPIQ
ncbi:hypothetical protein BM526_20015 (plasmid) [Alteromonas mediterranea]|uniref:type IV secretory system conjugative DNA transfer family protein n=1 Tax=Alteromonas mediterranea TaxID=314275 RepID=UPI00090450A6|nr:type IV secretory system conjugative DNA transfer family protein [Alteromonas mediterranea]APE04259.1 hypothetical protein BM526_20015 [Alteromonas mediterranea]